MVWYRRGVHSCSGDSVVVIHHYIEVSIFSSARLTTESL